MAEHIVDIERDVQPPRYVEARPHKDLSRLFEGHDTKDSDVLNVDVLNAWPSSLTSGLDTSQTEALQRILTKQLAIVQG
jgi:helicase required for RNAi-mediated heterochromatin assembly 1